ncbi:MAG: DUF2191 domain-containing protein [Verrucomicrobiota bacterium]
MRTTLTIEPDVAEKAKLATQTTGMTFKELINEALRCGIDQVTAPRPSRRYRTKARSLGLKRGLNYDNVADLLAQTEREDYR